jgi:regulator of replication initiation timing
MVKLISRLLVLILLGLVIYLYDQVTVLQREVQSLKSQVAQLSEVRIENRALRQRLAHRSAESSPAAPTDWLSSAREHVLNAEQAAAKGDFGQAYRETQYANLALSRAANSASSETRSSVQALRWQLQQVQTKAQSVWRQLEG